MANTGSVVDQRFALALAVPGTDILYTDFQLQRRCNAVMNLGAIILWTLAVLVQVDESGRNNVTRSVQHLLPFQRLLRDSGDLSVPNSKMPDRVQPGFRIHDAAVFDNDLEWCLGGNDQRKGN